MSPHASEATSRLCLTHEITGRVAYQRISPLLSLCDSVTALPASADIKNPPDFLWENAPRQETRSYRDKVKCYSHLPNGTAVLDSKWALARLFDNRLHPPPSHDSNSLSTLETHCFRGLVGFQQFCQRVNLLAKAGETENDHAVSSEPNDFPDLLSSAPPMNRRSFPRPPANLWVVKDASSNGAGGVWVVGPENAKDMSIMSSSPLVDDHRYVAQRYAWPPVLYGGRKCHVRVYGLVTSDERAFVHKRAFLHVANDKFQLRTPSNESSVQFQPSVHITNCCANSHDPYKFAGEICADLEADSAATGKYGQTVVPLQPFFPSIAASLATLVQRGLPLLRGGAANNGFEYLGMDFILSYTEEGQPIAYLLEVNAPPSQDTATGLDHAEDLHNEVMRDLLTLWIIPKCADGYIAPKPGGWTCVYEGPNLETTSSYIAPSKAVILNKIHLAIFEQKACKVDDEQKELVSPPTTRPPHNKRIPVTPSLIAAYARQQFPFFCVACRNALFGSSSSSVWDTRIFFENAGGAQVPQRVIQAMGRSLAFRHRVCVGSRSKADAREILATVLGATPDKYAVFLGPNASTLFATLASEYVRLGLLRPLDEVVISAENHLALSEPWVKAANTVGATVKWWVPIKHSEFESDQIFSHNLESLLTRHTRVVAVTHASNILGQVRDLAAICRLVKEQTGGYGHIIADGVATAPHVFPALSKIELDWYGVSCHKLFGPHLGALCGRLSTLNEIGTGNTNAADLEPDTILTNLEIGTISYEACEGVRGFGEYLRDLASFELDQDQANDIPANRLILENPQQTPSFQSGQPAGDASESALRCRCDLERRLYHDNISADEVLQAYRRMKSVEVALVDALIRGLKRSSKVRIIESDDLPCLERLPVICFLHGQIACSEIVRICKLAGVACRHGTFLSCHHLAHSFGFDENEGVVRLSLVHYNTLAEVEFVLRALELIPGWL
jgi:selenocysteine lyase/cysteine desulfurase